MPSPSKIKGTQKYFAKLKALGLSLPRRPRPTEKPLPIRPQPEKPAIPINRNYVTGKEKIFGVVESGIEYSYAKDMADRLAVWSRDRKAAGLSLKFGEFYEQLTDHEKESIDKSKYTGE